MLLHPQNRQRQEAHCGEDWMNASMVSIAEGGNEGSARPTPALPLAR
jgi:hypothetical protein